jgi:hypothetical protein
MTARRFAIGAVVAFALVCATAGIAAAATGLSRAVVGGGGGVSSGSGIELGATVGQAGTVGIASGSGKSLQSGFWYGLVCPDGDGLSDAAETSLGTDRCLNDTDGDSCSDGEEVGSDEQLGGDRNPLDPADFYDVTGDQLIDLTDALEILGRFGEGPGDPFYAASYDRDAPNLAKPWRTIFVSDGLDLSDALINLYSFGNGCVDPP